MTEHPLETTLRTALWRQFGTAIDMLENALLACPTSLWKERLWSVPPAIGVPAAVRGVLVHRFSCACLARPVSHRRPGGGICSPCSLCPRGARFHRGTARTVLYQGGATRLSRFHVPEVPHPASAAFGRAGAPARRVSVGRGATHQLSGVATLQSAPRAGTCGPTEPLSRTARHLGRGARLGPASEG
jgi:hypothetical protein